MNKERLNQSTIVRVFTVLQGHGKFIDRNTIEVNGQQLKFASAVIATGASASVPPIQVCTHLITATSLLKSVKAVSSKRFVCKCSIR